jgi:hypothetical protein
VNDHALLRRLWDIESIKRLKARYCRYIDYQDWAGLRALLSDDGEFCFPDDVVHGADAFVERVARQHTVADLRTVHHCHTPDIDVLGDGRARAYWALFDYADRVWFADGRRDTHHAYSYYYEEYVQDPDGDWKIALWRLDRLRVDRFPGDWFPFPDEAVPGAG